MKLNYRHISSAANEILDYIDGRRKGVIKSLRTRWVKLNKQLLGGFEPNIIVSIAGVSGSGKSSFVNQLETDIIDLNPDINIKVLSFNYEMLSAKQVGRKISSKMRKTVKDLYSSEKFAGKETMTDSDMRVAKKVVEEIKQYPIYYVDRPGTVDDMAATIDEFQKTCEKEGAWLVVILDHTLLTKGSNGMKEREVLYELQRMFMEKKKVGKTTIIQITQMNRGIESVERITNNALHYPIRSDIFGSDSVYQASDYLMVIHRPETIGITDAIGYGPSKLPVKDMIYIHLLKNREGEPKILSFKNQLKYNILEEYKLNK